MKLAANQLLLPELQSLRVGDRLILHWQTSPRTIRLLEGVVSRIDRDAFRVRYFRENDPNWETVFFWDWLDADGTSKGEYSWSFSRL